MGLDAVEIVMKVEESFDVVIEDAEAEKLRTPGQLIELVMSKVGRVGPDAACLTQRAFHRTRAALMRQGKLARQQISPDVPLVNLVPRARRQQILQCITEEIGLHEIPALERPRWLVNLLFASAAMTGLVAALVIRPAFSEAPWVNLVLVAPWFAGILAAILFGWLAALVTRPCRSEFMPSMTTVGGFSRWVVAHGSDILGAPPGQYSREQIAETTRHIIIDTLGCEKNYREDADFVKDLGLS